MSARTEWGWIERWRAELGTAHGRWHLVVLLTGLALSALMAARSQVSIDQFNLLARGWHLAVLGEWVPYGVWATGGGYHPGGVTSLLVGLPLLVWQHHRAPVLLVVASHVLAYLLLDATLRRALGPCERLLFAVLYWLSPWRLFFSAFLWNPNFLFLAGAFHLWSARRLRERAGFGDSFLHVLGLGVAIQIHISALLLVGSSLLLWWRRYLRLRLDAAVAATGVVALSLAPWVLTMAEAPERLPVSDSSFGHGLLTMTPILQGVLHWLRFAGVGLNRSMAALDFSSLGGPGLARLEVLLLIVRGVLSAATVIVAGWANWRLWRRAARRWSGRGPALSERRWLQGVVRWSFVAALLVFALSPIGVSGHGLLSVVHLTVLPVVIAVGAAARRSAKTAPLTVAYAVAMIVLGLGLALGSPAHRCGGGRGTTAHFTRPTMVADHRMFDRLGIDRSCPLVVDDPSGWWPDGLRPLDDAVATVPWDRVRLDTRGWTPSATISTARVQGLAETGTGGAR